MTWYPKAVQHPIKDHSEPGTLADKTTIVLHITDGGSAYSAIATFEKSVHPNRKSSHLVIDRDPQATVYQLVPLEDIAWHAGKANPYSIGIEHAARPNDPHFAITEQQYRASAALVAWLCKTLKIPCDREHVLGHHEADPSSTHLGCCAPTLDPTKVVAMAYLLLTS